MFERLTRTDFSIFLVHGFSPLSRWAVSWGRRRLGPTPGVRRQDWSTANVIPEQTAGPRRCSAGAGYCQANSAEIGVERILSGFADAPVIFMNFVKNIDKITRIGYKSSATIFPFPIPTEVHRYVPFLR